MLKNFILDTNVLLHDPRALFHFEDNNVVVPIYVIEEIDQFKRDLSGAGPQRPPGRALPRPVPQRRARSPKGSSCRRRQAARWCSASATCPRRWPTAQSTDNRILAVALDVKEKEPAIPAIFVTKDTNLRIRADALGLDAEDYDTEKVEISDIYTGMQEVPVAAADVDNFYQTGELPPTIRRSSSPPTSSCSSRTATTPSTPRWGSSAPTGAGWCRCIRMQKEGVWGIRPRNKEQSFALDLLLNDEVKLVTMVGKAGTGKTLHGHRRGPAQDDGGEHLPQAARLAARSSRWGATSATFRATSRRSSTPGCSPSSTTSSS